MRDRLLAELNDFGSGDEAAIWAHRICGVKNRLTAADARAYRGSVPGETGDLATPLAAGPSVGDRQTTAVAATSLASGDAAGRATAVPRASTRARWPFPEPRRVRDRDHVRFVAKQPCLICGRQPSDAHHLRFAQSRALGRKVSDEFTVPLCRGHHREVHRCGDEAAWWRKAGIDPTVTARALWLETHPLPTQFRMKWATTARPRPSVAIRAMPSVIGRSANEARITKRSQLSRLGPQ